MVEEPTKALPAIKLSQLPEKELGDLLDRAIAEYGEGESIYFIAARLGVEHTTLYRHLVKHREEQWKDAKISRALAELEDAENELKIAPDMLALSRARERCRAAQWQLERLMRKIYGQDAPAHIAQVVINVGKIREERDITPLNNQALTVDT